MAQSDGEKSFLPRLIEILPNKGIIEEIELCSHRGKEFIYVLEGVLDLYLENEAFGLYPGDSVCYSSEKSHNWANNTAKRVKFLVMNDYSDS